MAKKNSEKLLKMRNGEWRQDLKRGTCRIGGCDITKSTCQHLDAFLQDSDRQSVRAVNYQHIERLPVASPEHRSMSDDFRQKLLQYDLSSSQRQLLMLRFVYGYSFDDIAKEMRFMDMRALYALFSSTLQSLKEQGFSLGDDEDE